MTARHAAVLAALLALAHCGGPPSPPLRNEALRTNDAAAAACRADAERAVLYRDRGQIMRSDDYNARVGTSSYLAPRAIADDAARSYDRDRYAAECLRGARDTAPVSPSAPAGLTPTPSPDPTRATRR